MPEYQEAPDLQEIAQRLIDKVDQIAHVEAESVLWLRELEEQPKFLAKCYRFGDHPIQLFTEKPYAIVVYQSKVDYMSEAQIALLLLHEMMHIPETGDKLIDHDIKDFRAILEVNLDWTEPGAEVPDLIGKGNGKRRTKANG